MVDPKALPPVEVAELVVPAEELPRLRRQLDGVISRGKKYVTMRLSFKKRMRSEDVTLLAEARDTLTQAGGQLALASLQQDVATWLRMLDYDREFLIFDDVDAAELAHRRHAAGIKVGPRGAASAQPPAAEPAFQIVSRSKMGVNVRPRATVGKGTAAARAQAWVTVAELSKNAVPALVAEVERLTTAGVTDLVIDLRALEGLRGERVEALSEANTLARMKGARFSYSRVGRELRAFLKLVGLDGKLPLFDDEDQALLAHAQEIHAHRAYDELELGLARSGIQAATASLASPAASGKQAAASGSGSPRLSTPTVATPGAAPEAGAITREKKPAGSSSELTIPESEISFEAGAEADEPEAISPQEAGLMVELSQAKAEGERLKGELAALRAKAQQAEAQKAGAERKAAELEAGVKKSEKRLQELEQAKERAERRATEVEAAVAAAKAASDRSAEELKLVRAELERAKAVQSKASATAIDPIELEHAQARFREADYARNEALRIVTSSDEARKKLQAAVEQLETKLRDVAAERDEVAKQAAQLAQAHDALASKAPQVESRLRELEAHAQAGQEHAKRVVEVERERSSLAARVKELERSLEAAQRSGSGSAGAAAAGAGELGERVQKLEREKAEILVESHREIERLAREQEVLREELESAGEMIERLGKELELT